MASGARNSHGKPSSKGGRSRRPGRPSISNEALLDKALDLFLEHGFERTSIDAIATAASMAKRTLYARYSDKATLFKAALERAIENWIVPIAQLKAVESECLEATLLEIGQILVANVMRPAGMRILRITNAESARQPELAAFIYQATTARTITYLAGLFARRLGPGPAGDEDWSQAALAFLYLVVGGPPTMTAWGLEQDRSAVARHTALSVRLFLHGLLPRSGDPKYPKAPGMGAHGGLAVPSQGPSKAGDDGEALDDSIRTTAELWAENRRLKKLLIAALLESTTLREQLGDG